MSAILYRLYQSRFDKLCQLRKYLWKRELASAQRRNTYQVEQLENRYLLSADAAPLALATEFLNEELVFEQLIAAEVTKVAETPELQLVRQFEPEPDAAEVNDATATEAMTSEEAALAEGQDVAVEAEDSETTAGEGDPEAAALSEDEKAAIRLVTHLQGHQFVVVDRSVQDYESLLSSFMGEDAASLEWRTQSTSEGDVVIADWYGNLSAQEEKTKAEADESDADIELTEVDRIEAPQSQTRVTVVLLDEASDGVTQISDILSAYDDIAALHVLSHGAAGLLRLGNTSLSNANLERYRQQLIGWGKSLVGNGDILLYGCNVADGEVGYEFIDRMAGVTEADIAASADPTGNSLLGGDWILEYEFGEIETTLSFAANDVRYDGLLDSPINTTASETLLGTTGNDIYNFNITSGPGVDNFGKDIVDEKVGEGVDTLSFLGVSQDLTITIFKNGDVKVVDASGNNTVTAKNIENIMGGDGNDTFIFQKGASIKGWIDGGAAGTNTLKYEADSLFKSYTKSVSIEMSNTDDNIGKATAIDSFAANGFRNIQQVVGGKGGDLLVGSKFVDVMDGSKGDDNLLGKAGNDILKGGAGDDSLSGGEGADNIEGGEGKDTILADFDTDITELTASGFDNATLIDTLSGGEDDDEFVYANGVWGADVVDGGEDTDTVDFSAVRNDIEFTINGEGVSVSNEYSQRITVEPQDGESHGGGGPVFLRDQTLPTIEVPSPDLSFALKIGDGSVINVDLDGKLYEKGSDYEEPPGSPVETEAVITARYIAGSVIFEHDDGLTLSITPDGSTRSESGSPVFLRDVTPPTVAASVSDELTFKLRAGVDTLEFDVLVSSKDYSAAGTTDREIKNAWLADIEEAIRVSMSGDSGPSSTADNNAAIKKQWLEDIAEAIRAAMGESEAVIKAGYMVGNLIFNDEQGRRITIWENQADAVGSDSETTVTNTLINMNSIEVIKGGQGTNSYTFGATWQNEILIEDSVDAETGLSTGSLDFSAVDSATELTFTISGNGNVVVTGGSFTVTAKNIASINGGQGNDSFIFKKGASLAGNLDGGSGKDSLSYAKFDNAVSIIVPGIASNIGGFVSGIDSLVGSSKGDTLTGGIINGNTLIGGNGDDTLTVLAGVIGENVLDGGKGDDSLRGGLFEDTLKGGSGDDWLHGGGGVDTLQGDSGDDILDGGGDDDTLEGGSGDDWLDGGDDADTLDGGSGADSLVGGADADILKGGRGSDTYYFSGDWGSDTVAGESILGGTDTLSFAGVAATENTPEVAAVSLALTHTFKTDGSLQTVQDTNASNAVNVASGVLGNIEKLAGGSGDNLYVFEAGWDVSFEIDDRAGSNGTLDFSQFTGLLIFTIETKKGVSTVTVTNGTNPLTRDKLTALGVENLIGGSGDNRFVFIGDATLGGDISTTAGGTNTLDYSKYDSAATVNLANGEATGASSVSGIQNLIGSDYDDSLTGDAEDNVITGGKGDDTLEGGDGSDSYLFTQAGVSSGWGTDTLTDSGGDNDRLDFSKIDVALQATFENDNDVVITDGGFQVKGVTLPSTTNTLTINGSGIEHLKTGEGDDRFVFESSAEFGGDIDAGEGTDTLDYSARANGIVVNLATGSADGVSGLVAEDTDDSSIENVIGSAQADSFTGDDDDNMFVAGSWTAGVVDTIDGGEGTDTLSYARQTDTGIGLAIDLSTASDTVRVGADLVANITDDSIENLVGGDGDDIITGNAKVNEITGGKGDDSLDGGDEDDRFLFADDWGADTILGTDDENDRLDFSAVSADLSFDIGRNTAGDGSPVAEPDVEVGYEVGEARRVMVTDDSNAANRVTTDFNVERLIAGQGNNSYQQANTTVTTDMQANLLDGLDSVKAWANTLGGELQGLLDTNLPIINKSFADLFSFDFSTGVGAAVQTQLIDLLIAEFGAEAGLRTATNTDTIFANLADLSITPTTNLTEFGASLTLVPKVSDPLGFDLGGVVSDIDGVDLSADLQVNRELKFNFMFGVDPHDGDSFYIADPTLDFIVSLEAPNVNGGADLKVLSIGIKNGSVELAANVSAGAEGFYSQGVLDFMADPGVNTLPLGESELKLTPTLSKDSNYSASLPLDIAGLDLGDLFALNLNSPDLPGLPGVDGIESFFSGLSFDAPSFTDLIGAIDLSEISLSDLSLITDVLRDALDVLLDVDGIAFKDIPGLNLSIDDLLDIPGLGADGLKASLEGLWTQLDGFTGTLGELETWFNNQLIVDLSTIGLDADYQLGSLDIGFDGLDLGFEFDLGLEIFNEFAFGLDFDDLDLAIGSVLDFEAGGNMFAEAGFGLELDVGLDLFEQTPYAYLGDSTGISLALEAGIDDIDLKAALGPASLSVIGGAAVVEFGGRIGLKEGGDADGDGRYLLSELGTGSNWGADIGGAAEMELPLFFPTASLPMGGSEDDGNGDGFADNALYLGVDFDRDGFGPIEFIAPDLAGSIDLAALLNDPATVLKGLESMFEGIKAGLEGRFLEIKLPLIDDKLKEAADFIDGLREDLLGATNGALYKDGGSYIESGLGKFLEDAATAGDSVAETVIDLIRGELYDKLGGLLQVPVTENGDALLDADGNPLFFDPETGAQVLASVAGAMQAINPNTGVKSYDSRGRVIYRDVLTEDDIQISLGASNIQFNVLMAGNIFSESLAFNFDASAPGLGLSTDDASALNFALDYVFGLGFGLDGSDGIYLDTSGVTDEGAEFAMELSATLGDDTSLTATLGFLQASVEEMHHSDDATNLALADKYGVDLDIDGNSGLFAGLSLDLTDAGNDGRWTILSPTSGPEGIEASANLYAEANVDLGVLVDIQAADISLPKVTTVLHYDQTFADVTYSSSGGNSSTFGGDPVVMFENVMLDLGGLISDFLAPITEQLDPYIGADSTVRGIVDLLTTEVDIGIAKFTLIDFMKSILAPSSEQYKAILKTEKALEAVRAFSDFISLVNDAKGESIMLGFGDFTIGGGSSLLGSAPSNDGVATPIDDNDFTGKKDAIDPGEATGAGSKSSKIFTSTTFEGGGLEIPLIQDPKSILGLLMGRRTDLFIYNLPEFSFVAEAGKSFPIYPGLNARLFGELSIQTDLAFGYDTSGIETWKSGGFLASDLDKLIDGFYFVDDPDPTDDFDPDEVILTAVLGAGASLGIGGLIEAGVDGGIEARIGLDLADIPEAGTGVGPVAPVYDGRLYLDEIVQRIEQDPLCLFNIGGELTAFLEAFFWVGIDAGFFEITLFEARDRFVDILIASFDHSCPPPQADVAHLDVDTRQLTVRYVDGADADSGDANTAPSQVAVNYSVKQVNRDFSDDGIDNPLDWIQVNGNGAIEYFRADQVSDILIRGSNLKDNITVDENVDANLVVRAGGGDDRIILKNNAVDRSRSVYGEGGDDYISGTDASDNLYGGGQDDTILGNGGSDILDGGDGRDRIYGADAAGKIEDRDGDVILGGRGNDSIIGGAGDDTISGGSGNDSIFGNGGNDTIFGVDATNSVSNDEGNPGRSRDNLSGGAGDDIIHGGDGDDTIRGGTGLGLGDQIFGHDGADSIIWYAGDGKQSIDGNDGLDKLSLIGYAQDGSGVVTDNGTADNVVVSASGGDVSANWNGVVLKGVGIRALNIDTGEGEDSVLLNDLRATVLEDVNVALGSTRNIIVEERLGKGKDKDGNDEEILQDFEIQDKSDDADADRLEILGGSGKDEFIVTTVADEDAENGNPITRLDIQQVGGVTVHVREISYDRDRITVDAKAGNDEINAAGVTVDTVDDLRLLGDSGNDTLVGTRFTETIIGGSGRDRITGGLGEDTFVHPEYSEVARELIGDELQIDTLIEQRDANFTVSDTLVTIGDETETLNSIFEAFEFTGGASANRFELTNWSGNGMLDGALGNDAYIVNLTQAAEGANYINIDDSGGAVGKDSLEYYGSVGVDLIQFDTVYNPSSDPESEFTIPRWQGYGEYGPRSDGVIGGDGLLIAHFGAALAGYSKKDIDDTDALFEVGVSSLLESEDFQVVNYSTVEDVSVRGGRGDDVFISDDTEATLSVYGEQGDDQFYVGSILEVEDVLVEGQEITVAKQITRGTSYEMNIFGGEDDDYFEVSHNQGELNLYGDNGDDTFFIKALLTLDEEGNTFDLIGEQTNVNAGKFLPDDNDTREVDVDALVYVENANVNIDGGAGFDSVAVVGTALSDTFYVDVKDGVQRIFGAGIKLNQLVNIERLVLLTGAGDDRVFINGVDLGANSDMVINLGSGSDEVIIGSESFGFDVNFPKQNAIEYWEVDNYSQREPGYTSPIFRRTVYDVVTVPQLVTYTIRTPAQTLSRTLQGDRDLSNIKSPLTIIGGLGEVDRILLDNQDGPEDLAFSDTVLLKKQILTDDSKITYPGSAPVTNGFTDILTQALVSAYPQIAETLGDFVRNHILFQDKYIDTGLIDDIIALADGEQKQLLLAEGISYASFQDTSVLKHTLLPDGSLNPNPPPPPVDAPDAKDTYTARKQLEAFLEGTGFVAQYKAPYTIPGSDPEDPEIFYELERIENSNGDQLAFETQNRTILINEMERHNMIGVSLLTASATPVQVDKGYIDTTQDRPATEDSKAIIDGVTLVDSDALNTLTVGTNSTNIFFEGFDEAELQLSDAAENSPSTLLIDNDLFDGLLTVNGGEQRDEISVHATNAQTLLLGNGGDDLFIIGNGTVDAIVGEVILQGGSGVDAIVVENQQDTDATDAGFDKMFLEHQTEQEKLNKISSLLGLGESDSNVTVAESAELDRRLRAQTTADIKRVALADIAQFELAIALAGQNYAQELRALFNDAEDVFETGITGLIEDAQSAYLGGIVFDVSEYSTLADRLLALNAVKTYREDAEILQASRAAAESARNDARSTLRTSINNEYSVGYSDNDIDSLLADYRDADTLRDALREDKIADHNADITALIDTYKPLAEAVIALESDYPAEGDNLAAILAIFESGRDAFDSTKLAFDSHIGDFDAGVVADIDNQLDEYFAGNATADTIKDLPSLQAALDADRLTFENRLTSLAVEYKDAADQAGRDAVLVNIDAHLNTLFDVGGTSAIDDVHTQLDVYTADPDNVSADTVKDLASVQAALDGDKQNFENLLLSLAADYRTANTEFTRLQAYTSVDLPTVQDIITALQSADADATGAKSNLDAELIGIFDTLYSGSVVADFEAALGGYVDGSIATVDPVLALLEDLHTNQADAYDAILTPLLDAYGASVDTFVRADLLAEKDGLALDIIESQLVTAEAGSDQELIDLLRNVEAHKSAERDTQTRLATLDNDISDSRDALDDFVKDELDIGNLSDEYANIMAKDLPISDIVSELLLELDGDIEAKFGADDQADDQAIEDFTRGLDGLVTVFRTNQDARPGLLAEGDAYTADSATVSALISSIDPSNLRSSILADYGLDVDAYLADGNPINSTAIRTYLDDSGSPVTPNPEVDNQAKPVREKLQAILDAVDALADSTYDRAEIGQLKDAIDAFETLVDQITETSAEAQLVKVITREAQIDLGISEIHARLDAMQLILDIPTNLPDLFDLGIDNDTSFADIKNGGDALLQKLNDLALAYKSVQRLVSDYGLARASELSSLRDTQDSIERLRAYAISLPADSVVEINDLIQEYNANLGYYADTVRSDEVIADGKTRLDFTRIKASSEAQLEALYQERTEVERIVAKNGSADSYSYTVYSWWSIFGFGTETVTRFDKVQQDTIKLAADKLARLNNEITTLEMDRDYANDKLEDASIVVVEGEPDRTLTELDAELAVQYRLIKALGPLLLEVYLDPAIDHGGRDLEALLDKDDSLIASILSYRNDYAVVAAAGDTVMADPEFEYNGFSTVTSTVESRDYTALLSLTGLNSAGIHADYNDIEAFTLNLGGSDDEVQIGDSLGQAVSDLTVNSGAGNDRIRVSNEFGTVDDVFGNIRIDAGPGSDRLLVDDRGDQTGDSVIIGYADADYVNLSGMAAGEIFYYSVDGFAAGLNVHTSSGDDFVRIRALHGIDHTQLHASSGDDLIVVEPFEFKTGAKLSIFGDDGNDRIDAQQSPLLVTARGNDGNDVILGSIYADVLYGNDGDDIVIGDRGRVIGNLSKGSAVSIINDIDPQKGGNDVILLGNGDDIGIGGAGNDFIFGQEGNDVLFGDYVNISISAAGLRDMQSIIPVIGGNDSLSGGNGFDIIVGGAGNDVFVGALTEDAIIGNYARVRDLPGSSAVLVASDPTNRDFISASMFSGYRAPEVFDENTDREDRETPAEEAVSPLRTDRALLLSPLFDQDSLSQLSDSELRDFLRSLPLASSTESGNTPPSPPVEGLEVIVDTPEDAPYPYEEIDEEGFNEEVSQFWQGSPHAMMVAENRTDFTSRTDPIEDNASDSETSMPASLAAGLLVAGSVARRRGWDVTGLSRSEKRIQGDLQDLRKTQQSRQFSVWMKPRSSAADKELD
jgi:Ca2+-binding RTX toxin-like protein